MPEKAFGTPDIVGRCREVWSNCSWRELLVLSQPVLSLCCRFVGRWPVIRQQKRFRAGQNEIQHHVSAYIEMWLYWNTKERDHSFWVWHNHFFMKYCSLRPIRHVYDQKHVSNSCCVRVYRSGRFRIDVSSEESVLLSTALVHWIERREFDSLSGQRFFPFLILLRQALRYI
jgi:hypothetical protein